jgi:sec-independent protein translocase protein TatB
VFGQFGWGEMLLLIVVGLFVFGPEKLPTIARDAGKVIRQFRDTAKAMRDDLQAELGPELAELDLKSLHPRTLLEKHLLGDDDEQAAPAVASDIPLTKAEVDFHKPAARARPDSTPYDEDAT